MRTTNLPERIERAIQNNGAPGFLAELLARQGATAEMAARAVESLGTGAGTIDTFVAGAVRHPESLRHPRVAYLVGLCHSSLHDVMHHGPTLSGAAWSSLLEGMAERGLMERVTTLVSWGVPEDSEIPARVLTHILTHADPEVRVLGVRAAKHVVRDPSPQAEAPPRSLGHAR